MTTLEHLTKYYPLHVQRIVEVAVACNGYDRAMRIMHKRASIQVLKGAFVWMDTSEGHWYWEALSRAEHNTPHEIVI